MDGDGPEGAWVHERDANVALKVEQRARKAMRSFAAIADRPITRHPKVRHERDIAFEVHDLVLAPTFDLQHPPTLRDRRECARQSPPIGRMANGDSLQSPADNDGSQPARGVFDFGQFRHTGMMRAGKVLTQWSLREWELCLLCDNLIRESMAPRPPRSLRHEYELYVEQEIEGYKDSVPRNSLLSIGDEAVAVLRQREQLALDELLLCVEVDRIIAKRLRIPSYDTWRKRRVKEMDAMRRPERWGLSADDPLVRATSPGEPGRVLVAGAPDSAAPLYLAANGHRVTTLAREKDLVERVLSDAEAAGIGERVEGQVIDIRQWTPKVTYGLVVLTPLAVAGLSAAECDRVIVALQHATVAGGLHVVEFIAGKSPKAYEELRRRYDGWEVSAAEKTRGGFIARKGVA